jgi:hypothetical protein
MLPDRRLAVRSEVRQSGNKPQKSVIVPGRLPKRFLVFVPVDRRPLARDAEGAAI